MDSAAGGLLLVERVVQTMLSFSQSSCTSKRRMDICNSFIMSTRNSNVLTLLGTYAEGTSRRTELSSAIVTSASENNFPCGLYRVEHATWGVRNAEKKDGVLL